jgi:hypothetical protein
MIPEWLAADCDPLLDYERRFGGGQRVPLDRVQGIGQLEIVDVLDIAEPGTDLRTQPLEFGLPDGDRGAQLVHELFLSRPAAVVSGAKQEKLGGKNREDRKEQRP